MYSVVEHVRLLFLHDPVKPIIKSRFPGPAHQAAMANVSATQAVDGK